MIPEECQIRPGWAAATRVKLDCSPALAAPSPVALERIVVPPVLTIDLRAARRAQVDPRREQHCSHHRLLALAVVPADSDLACPRHSLVAVVAVQRLAGPTGQAVARMEQTERAERVVTMKVQQCCRQMR